VGPKQVVFTDYLEDPVLVNLRLNVLNSAHALFARSFIARACRLAAGWLTDVSVAYAQAASRSARCDQTRPLTTLWCAIRGRR
jgi:hypothetical protein